MRLQPPSKSCYGCCSNLPVPSEPCFDLPAAALSANKPLHDRLVEVKGADVHVPFCWAFIGRDCRTSYFGCLLKAEPPYGRDQFKRLRPAPAARQVAHSLEDPCEVLGLLSSGQLLLVQAKERGVLL